MTTSGPRTDLVVDVLPVVREDWYALAHHFLDFGYRHAWDFNTHHARRQGSDLEHVKIATAGDVLGLAAVRIKRLPLAGTGVAYVGGGPLTRRGEPDDLERLDRCLVALSREYVERRKLVLRVSAPVCAPDLVEPIEQVYRSAGFDVAPNLAGYRTLLLDLDSSVDDLKAGLKKNWRRDLNRSLRADWDVEIGTDPVLFERFRDLFERFVDWKSFDVEHDARFHEAVQADLPPDARYLIVLVSSGGELGGGVVVARTGDTACYILGAMNPELRKLYPGYALQWLALTHVRDQGLRWYDTGGIDPEGNEGVYKFKLGMAPLDVTAPGPFERAPGKVRVSLVRLAEGAYGRLARLRRH